MQISVTKKLSLNPRWYNEISHFAFFKADLGYHLALQTLLETLNYTAFYRLSQPYVAFRDKFILTGVRNQFIVLLTTA